MRYVKDRSAGWQRVMRWANVNSSMLCSASLRNTGLKRIADQVRLLLFATDPTILNQLATLELVHILEAGHGRMRQTRDRHLMGIGGRQVAGLNRIGDFPRVKQMRSQGFSGHHTSIARCNATSWPALSVVIDGLAST